MFQFQEVVPGDRVIVRSDRPFRCYLGQDAVATLFMGPHDEQAKVCSFQVPRGDYTTCQVDCDADAMTTIDVAVRAETPDPTRLVEELEMASPTNVRDLIANEIARLMHEKFGMEPESIEEANDFDIEDDLDDAWESAAVLVDEDFYHPPEPTPRPAEIAAPEASEGGSEEVAAQPEN